MSLLAQFVYLQLLDLLTTLVLLLRGVGEANPFVRLVMEAAPSPLHGLVLLKLMAVALALYCLRQGRTRLLVRINVLFAAVVLWNMLAMLVQAATPA